MKSRPVCEGDLLQIMNERNEIMETLRTGYPLNYDMQREYYKNVLCNRESGTFYKIYFEEDKKIAFGGIEFVQWCNRLGEISLIVFEEFRGKGYGSRIVYRILRQGFDYLGLENLYAEVYCCNTVGLKFWEKMAKKYNAQSTVLPNRKYYKGHFWDSYYYNFNKDDFNG